MEKKWELIQEMVANLTPERPEACGTEALEDLATPVQVNTTPKLPGLTVTTLEGSGGPTDLIGTLDLTSPVSWSNFPSLSTMILHAWKSAVPQGLSQ